MKREHRNKIKFLKEVMEERGLDYKGLSKLTDYSIHSVRSWFTDPNSTRWRPVPDRAITILKLKLDQ